MKLSAVGVVPVVGVEHELIALHGVPGDVGTIFSARSISLFQHKLLFSFTRV